MSRDALLLAFFRDERYEDGEQIRFAVRDESSVTWTEVGHGAPILRSTVGERGVRDPFLVRLPGGEVVLIATDLRIWPDSPSGWDRAVRRGSRSIVVWRTLDLAAWSEPRLVEVSPPEAGNTWAPKAFWSDERGAFLVFWASALFDEVDRSRGEYQRILFSETKDFMTFSPPTVYLDRGHDVIDVTFAKEGGEWFRFSVDAAPPIDGPLGYITLEVGQALEDPEFRPVETGIGAPELSRAEGPAIAPRLGTPGWTLLVDEFGLRGYQVFETTTLEHPKWAYRGDAGLPSGSRHGSMLSISAKERDRLLSEY